MGISSTTKIVCDYSKDGKPCGKIFLLPDDPKFNTPGVENTCSVVLADGRRLYFCSILHMVAFGVNIIKNTPQSAPEVPQPAKVIPISGRAAEGPSIEQLLAAGIIEPETEVPPAPENLDLGDNL